MQQQLNVIKSHQIPLRSHPELAAPCLAPSRIEINGIQEEDLVAALPFQLSIQTVLQNDGYHYPQLLTKCIIRGLLCSRHQFRTTNFSHLLVVVEISHQRGYYDTTERR